MSAEGNTLSVIPPDIFILLADKQNIIIYLSSHQFIEVFKEWTYILDVGMGAVARHRANFEIRLMERFEIFAFLAAAYDNHRIIMACENIIHHQSGDTSITVFKGMYADITVVEQRGQLHWR